MWFKKKSQEPEAKQTPFGEFVKKNGLWECFVEVEDAEEIRVCVSDVEGELCSRIFSFIPFVVANLPQLEQAAREIVPKLTDQHFFDSVSDCNEEADFSLVFSYQQEHWGETVYVGFKNGEVTDSWSYD